jgi:hypothetical protein
MFSSATYQDGSSVRRPLRLARNFTCIAALVSLITVAGCGGDGDSTAPGTPGGEMPQDWVGQWQGAISGTPFLPSRVPGPAPDLTSIGSSVLGYAWAFGEDGEYEHVWQLDMDYSFGACIVRLFWQEEGTATLSGTTLTLNPERWTPASPSWLMTAPQVHSGRPSPLPLRATTQGSRCSAWSTPTATT